MAPVDSAQSSEASSKVRQPSQEDVPQPDRARFEKSDSVAAGETNTSPAHEPTESDGVSDEKKPVGGPYTESNRPALDDVRGLPIGAPSKPESPEYKSSLNEQDWQVYDRTPDVVYRRKLTETAWGDEDETAPRRLVRGRVFEIVGGERIPLSGMMVYGGGTRVFTDEDGWFEMMGTFREPNQDDKIDGQTYRVDLRAHANGYIALGGGSGGIHTYTNLDETENGIELYVVRRESRLIRIRFENPQVCGGKVTVILSDNESVKIGHAVDWDEKLFIRAEVDPNVESWFTVPLHHHDLESDGFGLRSVSAPNILPDIKTLAPVSRTNEESEYLVMLIVEDTVTIAGTATDMQTGDPIPYARIYGPGCLEFTVADEQGRFELISAKNSRGPRGELIPEGTQLYLKVSDVHYATMAVEVTKTTLLADDSGGLLLGPGGNLSGPWTFQLRRWVEATVDCTFLEPASRAGAELSMPYYLVDALPGDSQRELDADGHCHFPRVPWGIPMLRLNIQSPFGAKKLVFPLSSWNGDAPYQLVPTIPDD